MTVGPLVLNTLNEDDLANIARLEAKIDQKLTNLAKGDNPSDKASFYLEEKVKLNYLVKAKLVEDYKNSGWKDIIFSSHYDGDDNVWVVSMTFIREMREE